VTWQLVPATQDVGVTAVTTGGPTGHPFSPVSIDRRLPAVSVVETDRPFGRSQRGMQRDEAARREDDRREAHPKRPRDVHQSPAHPWIPPRQLLMSTVPP
jgi:hypothetical protein